jgi:hypothetical protein
MPPYITSDISFLDYRYQNKEYWERRTKEKLKGQLGPNWDNRKFLENYTGVGSHAAKEYLQNQETGRWCRRAKGDIRLKFDD